MRKKIVLSSLLLLWVVTVVAQYVPDMLGEPFVCRTIHMPNDYEGEVVCTLIKRTGAPQPKAALYVHGYNDYFFQKEMADEYALHGYDFYAVDLRKYGRSMRPHQTPFFVKDIREYFPDIDTTLAIIRSEGHSEVVLAAHSTGGLITTLYMNDRKAASPNALILNSPFFDWYLSPWKERALIPLVSWWGGVCPRTVVMGASKSQYGASLYIGEQGEWSYDLQKKRDGNDMLAGWVRAIACAQKELQQGLSIPVPILVLCSDSSMYEGAAWSEAYHTHDIVLDERDIRRYAKVIGANVTIECFSGGKHDLVLSSAPVREQVYRTIFEWLKWQRL